MQGLYLQQCSSAAYRKQMLKPAFTMKPVWNPITMSAM